VPALSAAGDCPARQQPAGDLSSGADLRVPARWHASPRAPRDDPSAGLEPAHEVHVRVPRLAGAYLAEPGRRAHRLAQQSRSPAGNCPAGGQGAGKFKAIEAAPPW
jgi:hypothetical protein